MEIMKLETQVTETSISNSKHNIQQSNIQIKL